MSYVVPPNFLGEFATHTEAVASVSGVYTDQMAYWNTTDLRLWWWRDNFSPDGYGGYNYTAGWYLYNTWDTGNFYQDGYGGYTNNLGEALYSSKALARIYASAIIPSQLKQDFRGKHFKQNSFLYHQQALCQGPINRVWDVIVDESKFLTDITLGTNSFEINGNIGRLRAAMRIDVHNGVADIDGNFTADSIMAKNYGSRRTATFDNVAYTSVVTHLDRVNPQMTSVPTLQFLMEGKLVHTIVRTGIDPDYTYELSTLKTYSNNPAYVLLDYLKDNISGRAIALEDINLESFYNSAQVCAKIVQLDALVTGNIWRPINFGRTIFFRDLPLYECNIVLDPEKEIRENVEAILTTMGDARLIWSQGQYYLSVFYPETEAEYEDIISGTITDDDIVMDQDIEIAYPDATNRYNSATVKFSNEAENFKDDQVTWPAKFGYEPEERTFLQGLGAFAYPTGYGGWEVKKLESAADLLSNYSVWNGVLFTSTVEFLIIITKDLINDFSGDLSFTLKTAADSKIVSLELQEYLPLDLETMTGGNVTGPILFSGSTNKATTLNTTRDLGSTTEDKVYKLTITANDESGLRPDEKGGTLKSRGIAAKLMKGSNIIWSSREETYSVVEKRKLNNYLYWGYPADHAEFPGKKGFLEEDNGKELNTEMYAEGITDHYHALAKAEELVRTSRGTFRCKLPYKVRDKIYEPGDIVRLNSETLKLGHLSPLYFRVDATNISNEYVAELELTRVDHTFLAWNVKDDEYIAARSAFTEMVPPVPYITYVAGPVTYPYTSMGRLEWEHVNYQNFKEYMLYMHIPSYEADANGFPIFKDIGRTTKNTFDIPPTDALFAIFGITVINRDNRESERNYTNMLYDDITGEYTVRAVGLNVPWLSPTGQMVFSPTGAIGTDATVGGDPLVDVIVPPEEPPPEEPEPETVAFMVFGTDIAGDTDMIGTATISPTFEIGSITNIFSMVPAATGAHVLGSLTYEPKSNTWLLTALKGIYASADDGVTWEEIKTDVVFTNYPDFTYSTSEFQSGPAVVNPYNDTFLVLFGDRYFATYDPLTKYFEVEPSPLNVGNENEIEGLGVRDYGVVAVMESFSGFFLGNDHTNIKSNFVYNFRMSTSYNEYNVPLGNVFNFTKALTKIFAFEMNGDVFLSEDDGLTFILYKQLNFTSADYIRKVRLSNLNRTAILFSTSVKHTTSETLDGWTTDEFYLTGGWSVAQLKDIAYNAEFQQWAIVGTAWMGGDVNTHRGLVIIANEDFSTYTYKFITEFGNFLYMNVAAKNDVLAPGEFHDKARISDSTSNFTFVLEGPTAHNETIGLDEIVDTELLSHTNVPNSDNLTFTETVDTLLEPHLPAVPSDDLGFTEDVVLTLENYKLIDINEDLIVAENLTSELT
jgi:hypothetical protein